MKRWLPVLIALAPTYLIRFSIGGIPTTLFELLIYGTVLWSLVRKPFTIHYSRFTRPWLAGVGLILLGALIGTLVSLDTRVALGEIKGFLIDPLLIAWLVLRHLDADDLPAVVSGYVTSAAAVSLISLLGWLMHAPWAVSGDSRLLGLYGIEANANPNYLAFWVAPAVAIGIAWFGMAERSRRSRWLMLLATIVSAAALVGTESRAGIAAALVAGGLALVAYYRSTLVELRYAQGLGWVMLIGLVAFGAALTQPNYSLSPEEGGRITTSNNIRWDIWRITGELLGTDGAWVTGLGVGSYQTRFDELTKDRVNFSAYITPRAYSPHNLWLNTWVNLGLMGVVGLTLLLILAIRSLWQHEPTHRATLLIALLAAILIQGLVDSPGWKNDSSVLLWLALAGALMLDRLPVPKKVAKLNRS